MNEDLFKNRSLQPKNPDIANQEKLEVRVEIATEKDWESYKEIRLFALSSKDTDMLGFNREDFSSEENKSEHEWRRELKSMDDFFIVLSWSGSDVVGMGIAIRRSQEVWSVTYDYVRESFRGIGIQKRMIAERLKEIKNRGGLRVTGLVMANNTASINSTEFFGFKKFYTTSVKVDGKSRSAHKMELDLTDPEVIKKINEVLDAR